ncbi:hypothetical protein TNCV_2642841 [Trichonephila clavipes]|nr:hypothetical protein TNCV_2642841 [Trichonephila clavipes]
MRDSLVILQFIPFCHLHPSFIAPLAAETSVVLRQDGDAVYGRLVDVCYKRRRMISSKVNSFIDMWKNPSQESTRSLYRWHSSSAQRHDSSSSCVEVYSTLCVDTYFLSYSYISRYSHSMFIAKIVGQFMCRSGETTGREVEDLLLLHPYITFDKNLHQAASEQLTKFEIL